MCVPPLPKIFRPVTRNALIFFFFIWPKLNLGITRGQQRTFMVQVFFTSNAEYKGNEIFSSSFQVRI